MRASCCCKRIADLRAVIKARALEHKSTVMIGRSHGIHAEPITFGLKLLVWYDEFGAAASRRCEPPSSAVAVGKVSGSVGTFAHAQSQSRRVRAAGDSGLEARARVAPGGPARRARRARVARCAFAGRVRSSSSRPRSRHLQRRPKCCEVEEPFKKGQKGARRCPTSATPSCASACGLARLIRADALAAMRERGALARARHLALVGGARDPPRSPPSRLDYIAGRNSPRVVKDLVVYPENMKRHHMEKDATACIYSQKPTLELAREGFSREDAYALVQEAAMGTWETGKPFEDTVRARKGVTSKLDAKALATRSSTTLDDYLKEIDTIFARALYLGSHSTQKNPSFFVGKIL